MVRNQAIPPLPASKSERPPSASPVTMRPFFVGGCGRSGTTLLASLLAGHRRVVAPPEAQFFLEGLAQSGNASQFAAQIASSWRYRLWGLPSGLPAQLAAGGSTTAELMAGLAQAYAERLQAAEAAYWVDHTPINIGFVPTLLEQFPTAPVIHILRDPRAVVASVLPLDWGPATAREGARWWMSRLAMGLAAEARYPERVVRVRFEDLVAAPDQELERLCARIGIGFEPEMAAPTHSTLPAYTRGQHELVGRAPDPARAEAWRTALSPRQIEVVEGELKGLLTMLGYEPLSSQPGSGGGGSARELLAQVLGTARQRLRHRLRVRRGLAAREG